MTDIMYDTYFIECLAWIGNVFYVVGVTVLARKNAVLGQTFNGIGGLIYAVYGFMIGAPALWTLSLFLSAINAYGVYNWSKSKEN